MSVDLEDRAALRELAERYARAVDRRDYALAETLFCEDAELIGPGFQLVGRDRIVRSMRRIESYTCTQHFVHNQLVTLEGEHASAETYGLAVHLYERDGEPRKLDWGIRYQDRFARTEQGWRFARRELVVDWVHDVPLGTDPR